MKLCITCKNCNFDEPYCYSEITWDDGRISCNKNKIEYDAPIWKQSQFLKWNRFAESCEFYKPANSEE